MAEVERGQGYSFSPALTVALPSQRVAGRKRGPCFQWPPALFLDTSASGTEKCPVTMPAAFCQVPEARNAQVMGGEQCQSA